MRAGFWLFGTFIRWLRVSGGFRVVTREDSVGVFRSEEVIEKWVGVFEGFGDSRKG